MAMTGLIRKFLGDRELSPRYTIEVYRTNGGDLASTWVAKPEVHAEVQNTS